MSIVSIGFSIYILVEWGNMGGVLSESGP